MTELSKNIGGQIILVCPTMVINQNNFLLPEPDLGWNGYKLGLEGDA